jgi:hypothetical protein
MSFCRESAAKNLALGFSAHGQQGEIDSSAAAPRQFTAKTGEKIAFSGSHGFVVSRMGEGAEAAVAPSNTRCTSIRYDCSRPKEVCQASNSDTAL